MESNEKIRQEEEKEERQERRVLIYLLLGMIVIVGLAYLHSSGALRNITGHKLWMNWKEPSEETIEQERTRAERQSEAVEQRERRSKPRPQSTKEASEEKREAVSSDIPEERGAIKIDTLSSSGVLALTLVAPKGTSRNDLTNLCRTVRVRSTGKTRFTLAIYADTPIGQQIANGTIKTPSPEMIKLNRLLLYTFDPVKGERYDFSPLSAK
jgi:cytoskeletal protein RodZ